VIKERISGAHAKDLDQFHDKYVDKLGWIDEQMVSLEPAGVL
jgi:hypothetical protein